MKGFKEPEETAILQFEGGKYAGAEVRVRLNVPLGQFLALQAALQGGDQLQAMTNFGARVLVAWNMEDDQGPIPADGEGMKRITPQFALVLLEKWAEAVAQPPTPLVGRSVDLSTLAAASTPLANGSMSRES